MLLANFLRAAQTDIHTATETPSADDFLAREKALLGDDADQFVSAEGGGDDDLLGGGAADNALGDSTFEAQFPDITSPAEVCHDCRSSSFARNAIECRMLTSSQALHASGPSVSYNSGYQAYADENEVEEEPEVVKEWREKRDAQIAKRAEQHQRQREETVAEAQRNIDDFYENYNNKKEKNIAQTRKEAEEFLASREDITSGGTSWERIAKLVDISGKGTRGGAAGSGKERFRELLLSLRKDEKAPGAEGY